jgi:hypothetical protein
MDSIKSDVIGGFNSLLEEQKKQPGECFMTYAQFDNQYDEVFSNVDIQLVKPLTEETFVPRGSTALLDSWGRLIGSVKTSIYAMEEEDRPGNIVMVVITDGAENTSKEFKRHQIFDMVEAQKKEGWTFTFIAANQDAIQEAARYGIDMDTALSFSANASGVGATYGALSNGITRSRKGKRIKYSHADRARSMSIDPSDLVNSKDDTDE